MRKRILIVFLFGITIKSFSQQKLLNDSIIIDNSTILIATSAEHKDLEFCIVNPIDIRNELGQLTYGQLQEAPFEKNPLGIKLISKGLIVQAWVVKTKASAIEINKKKYYFDVSQLSKLAKKYPIDYTVEEKDFQDKTQLADYYSNLLKDKKFLYIVPPDFDNQWQGKFQLIFDRSDTLNSPLAISKYLRPKFEVIEKKNKFSISYQPFEAGKNDGNNRFTMTIYGTEKLYKEFSDKITVKGEWQPQPYRAYIIRRK